MNLTALRNPDARERHLAILRKRLMQRLRRPCDSKPIFVVGKQRSGTSMLMLTFHQHPDALVFDEHRDNDAFDNYRIRSVDTVRALVKNARFPAVCFKPLCDSHRIDSLYEAFPDGHYIWLYRDYADAANSTLRKFDAPTRSIRLVCTKQTGGGWFQDGVSEKTAAVLYGVYRDDMTDFDLACLSWWTRNQIIIESGLIGRPNVTLLKYEALVSQPRPMFEWLHRRVGLSDNKRVGHNVSARSIGRHAAPQLDARVRELCDQTLNTLDEAFNADCPVPFVQDGHSA